MDNQVKIISSYELRDKLKDQPKVIGYKTEFNQLDALIEGLFPGQLVTMSGQTKCGKTSFCQTLTYNLALNSISCLWFTYEVPVSEFLSKYPDGQIPLFYLPEALRESTTDWIEKHIVKAIQSNDIKVVFIDHLHYLIPLTGAGNVSILIGFVMRELKKIALKYNIIIFILAHTKKVSTGEKPVLEHIRDSSLIAQESDLVLMISRPNFDEDDENINLDTSAKVRVLACRKTGKRGIIKYTYKNGLYEEV